MHMYTYVHIAVVWLSIFSDRNIKKCAYMLNIEFASKFEII